ncbi:MAG: hypothetical protein CMM69_01035 [Rhodospirillaceae bacterium]|nr:hypothetical protein [Rhodospirillaceae bacterium]OUX31221.1 MAG: hypothetical protein CBE16_01260 [Rhodospirillaceae bacterium TMED256]
MCAVFHWRDVECAVQPAKRDEGTGHEPEFNNFRIGKKRAEIYHERVVHRVVRDRHPFREIKRCRLTRRLLGLIG